MTEAICGVCQEKFRDYSSYAGHVCSKTDKTKQDLSRPSRDQKVEDLREELVKIINYSYSQYPGGKDLNTQLDELEDLIHSQILKSNTETGLSTGKELIGKIKAKFGNVTINNFPEDEFSKNQLMIIEDIILQITKLEILFLNSLEEELK